MEDYLSIAKSLHYVGFATIMWASFMKNRLMSPREVSRETISRAWRFDKLSFLSTVVLQVSGISMVLWFAKPASYYTASPVFHLKIGVFVLVSVLILVTKVYLRKGGKGELQERVIVPGYVRNILRLDFVGLLVLTALGYLLMHHS